MNLNNVPSEADHHDRKPASGSSREGHFDENYKSGSPKSENEIQKELADTKDKLKIITGKFQNARKERDQLKEENKELSEQVLQLQSSIRQMVPCMSNTSSSFPMLLELQNQVAEFYKCDCQDAFFDLLCPELNMDGIVYFFENSFPKLVEVIEKHFAPLDQLLCKTMMMDRVEGPVTAVLKKSYQSNWKAIFNQAVPRQFLEFVM